MNLHDYFNSPGSLSASELAGRIGVKSVAQVRQWQHGYANRLPSSENCLAIERATDGKVTRQDLRPDDFWKIWPDLSQSPAMSAPIATETVAPAATVDGEAGALREGVVRRHANRRASDTPVHVDRRAPIGKVFYSIDKGEA